MSAGDLLVPHLGTIDLLVSALRRRHGMDGDDADDFASWARMKLLEDDCAVVRSFQGRSSLRTYLAVVIANLLRDYRVQRWGRWRASAEARRLGPVAVRLEALMYRDGYGVAQAVDAVRSSGIAEAGVSELTRLAFRLPRRQRPRPTEVSASAEPEAPGRADDPFWQTEQAQQWEVARRALARALQTLPAEDQLILRMRYWDGSTVAEISRALGLNQKALYRRIDALLRDLRPALEREGVDRGTVAELLSAEVVA